MVMNRKIFGIENKFMRIIKACKNSIDGLTVACKEEAAFRQILLLVCAGLPLAFIVSNAWVERIILILPLALCVIVELLNTAIENICDKVTTDYDLFIKKAKDLGSAAQFICQALLVLIWLTYFVM